MPWMVEAEKIAKIQGCRKRFVEHMKTVEYPENITPFDAEKAKLCSDGQIFPRNGRFRIADAQEFLDEWAAQRKVGPCVWTDGCEGCTDYLKGPYKGGKARLRFIKSLGYKVSASSLNGK